MVICENSVAVTMSTGNESLGGIVSGLAASDQTLHSNTAAWPMADMVQDVLITSSSNDQRAGPCSVSVTKATRRNPAADIRPITFMTVP